uniref:Kallikrein-related peptidase 9 variant 2 n=1 Tax=Canis lupus familiaris TaxID=9615 RepID=D2IJT8_CANLF|nr:kallikrein-related peptidase 9 variant 2 [Canis lupus familiaris]ADA77676.1 kallikrein-related peptidase 9 variant 3 [Canis lupus familiaris]
MRLGFFCALLSLLAGEAPVVHPAAPPWSQEAHQAACP